MPAVVVDRTLFAWSAGGCPPSRQREREEHAYRWQREESQEAWVGEERESPPPPADGYAGKLERLHDLRHQLTRAELEFEAGEPARARAVLAQVRVDCEEALGLRPPRALDLVRLCSEEARAAARVHEGREIQTSLPRECALQCNESLLRRLLSNLLANALRVTGEREAVRFELGRQVDGGARLTIRDQGGGIEREAIDRLLGSRASASGSSGVGSLSVLECARGLRATIEVESEPGVGCCFAVRLPG